MRARLKELAVRWRASGHTLGFGVGIAHGYATLGSIGFEGRSDYSAIGTVVNLAARLCAEAGDGHILVDSKVRAAIEDAAHLNRLATSSLKGCIGSCPPSTFTQLYSRTETCRVSACDGTNGRFCAESSRPKAKGVTSASGRLELLPASARDHSHLRGAVATDGVTDVFVGENVPSDRPRRRPTALTSRARLGGQRAQCSKRRA